MRWMRTPALACAALAAFSGPAAAGTVTITVTDDGNHNPNGGCTASAAASPSQFLVQAGGSGCEWRLPIDAVPGSRAGDIVSARAVVRVDGVSGSFKLGLRGASGGAPIGTVTVPAGDHVVVTHTSAGPFQTSSGTLTLDLQSTGTAAVKVAGPAARRLVLRVTDTHAPRVLGPITPIPADVAIGAPVAVGALVSDDGPDTAPLPATIQWGDGASSAVATARPAVPFPTAAMATGLAQYAYAVPGRYVVSVDVTDTAGNPAQRTLGRVRVWEPPANVRSPRVRGTMAVGSLLTCSPGGWTGTGGPSPFVFRWLRGAAMIPGQALDAYRLTLADRGLGIACRVTGRNPTGASATVVSPGRRLWMTPVAVHRPSIHGRRRAGARILCLSGVWLGPPARFRISWVRDGRLLQTHLRRLRLRRADRGARIRCRVTASNPAGRRAVSSRTIRVRR